MCSIPNCFSWYFDKRDDGICAPAEKIAELNKGLAWLQGLCREAVYALGSPLSSIGPEMNRERFQKVDYFNPPNVNYLASFTKII